jgi:hypothetical protein
MEYAIRMPMGMPHPMMMPVCSVNCDNLSLFIDCRSPALWNAWRGYEYDDAADDGHG